MEAFSENEETALHRFNSLTKAEAELQLLSCCGASAWAREVASRRPFRTAAEFIETADRVWWSLEIQDWLQAFSAHPKIGERKAEVVTTEQSRSWSAQEQAGVDSAAAAIRAELARLNQEYDAKFGFSFIVCATGKTSEEMLSILRNRLTNNRDQELRTAAEEQAKITELRIKKLLNQ